MKCPHCMNSMSDDPNGFVRGKCNSCYDKDRTCTECRHLVEPAHVYIVPSVGSGHKECLDTARAYKILNDGKIEVKDGRIYI